MGISKTDFMRGMQCRKMLWLDKHRPELKVIPPEVQERLDKGNEFGDEAMGMFGPFVEVTSFKEDGRLNYTQMIKDTKAYLEDGEAVICEAAFSYCGHYCAVDILRRAKDGFEIYEVKNSTQLSEQFVADVGFQRYIVTRCGVKVVRCFVVLKGDDEASPYNVVNVTAPCRQYSEFVGQNIWELNKVKLSKQEIEVPVGSHCLAPYECWYYGFCHGKDVGEAEGGADKVSADED